MSDKPTAIATDAAPKAIGPYSQAIAAAGRFLFCSGQIALDPATGEIAGASDIREQTRRVMENLRGVLAAASVGFDSVVKTTIYLTDLAYFGHVNEIYGSYFAATPPARATVQVSGLPRGALVEIEAIAVLP